jgi:glycosyltransferase involved in cell wall biosynthesis
MPCANLKELPPPPHGKEGWPWTVQTLPPLGPSSDSSTFPKVSIVIPSFNQGEHIEQAIRSVLLQGYPNLELIIIDGGSSDASLSIIHKYKKWLDYWVSEPDAGATNAVNKGFTYAHGELFGIMCADDFYLLGGIIKLFELRQSKPDSVAWVGACPEVHHLDGKVFHQGRPFINSDNPNQIGHWGVEGWFFGVACLFDAYVFRQVGCFDEKYITGNDIDLWNKLIKQGSFTLTNEPVAISRLNPQSLSHRDRALELSAWITSNYINEDYDVAKRILLRYGEEQAKNTIASITPNEFINIKGRKAVIKAIVRSILAAVKRRLNILINILE